jgi:hypothetical protein
MGHRQGAAWGDLGNYGPSGKTWNLTGNATARIPHPNHLHWDSALFLRVFREFADLKPKSRARIGICRDSKWEKMGKNLGRVFCLYMVIYLIIHPNL